MSRQILTTTKTCLTQFQRIARARHIHAPTQSTVPLPTVNCNFIEDWRELTGNRETYVILTDRSNLTVMNATCSSWWMPKPDVFSSRHPECEVHHYATRSLRRKIIISFELQELHTINCIRTEPRGLCICQNGVGVVRPQAAQPNTHRCWHDAWPDV